MGKNNEKVKEFEKRKTPTTTHLLKNVFNISVFLQKKWENMKAPTCPHTISIIQVNYQEIKKSRFEGILMNGIPYKILSKAKADQVNHVTTRKYDPVRFQGNCRYIFGHLLHDFCWISLQNWMRWFHGSLWNSEHWLTVLKLITGLMRNRWLLWIG